MNYCIKHRDTNAWLHYKPLSPDEGEYFIASTRHGACVWNDAEKANAFMTTLDFNEFELEPINAQKRQLGNLTEREVFDQLHSS